MVDVIASAKAVCIANTFKSAEYNYICGQVRISGCMSSESIIGKGSI